MKNSDLVNLKGNIEEILAAGFFRVRGIDGTLVLAKARGKLRRAAQRLMVGDTVIVQLSPQDLTTGLISEIHGKP